MSVIAILIDWWPSYLGRGTCPGSLLVSPLGASSLLEHLHPAVRRAASRLIVLPNFAFDRAYRACVHAAAPDAEILGNPELRELAQSQEPSDLLLVIDSRYYPLGGLELDGLLQGSRTGGFARHLVHHRQSGDAAHEYVVCGPDRRVRAVQRLYDGITHLETVGVSCMVLPAAAARFLDENEPLGLAGVRARLSAVGVPSQDIRAQHPVLDLWLESDLLALNEHLTASIPQRHPPGFEELAPRVWAAADVRLSPSARLYAPVVLHRQAVVEADAVIIGPAVVGAGARVGAGATVSQALLGRGARVPASGLVVHRFLAEDAVEPPPARAVDLDNRVLPALRLGRDAAGQGPAKRPGGRYDRFKRAFDFLAALGGLLVTAPLLLIAAICVRLSSRGPVFYGDEREGRGGRVFRCWKFRTMVVGAHAQQRALYGRNIIDGPQFKLPNDPRITPLGRWLRKTNIDELPQLWNVLRGDMSLIGPRPSPFRENQICVPWRQARLSVRPGISGLWQVCRHERQAGDFHQWIHFDIMYVRHVSFGLDLRILLATLLTLGGCWSVPVDWILPPSRLRRNGRRVGAGAGRTVGRPAPQRADAVEISHATGPS